MEHGNGVPRTGPTLRMQPVLIVGLGGIGHRIVLFLKALLIGLFGTVPTGIRLLVIDIDVENLTTPAAGQVVGLEAGREMHCIGPVPVARIRHNLNRWPTIRARLGGALQALLWVATATAAQMLRPLGQLALQWQFDYVQKVVRGALWSLAGRDNQGNGDGRLVDPSQGFKVFVVGSLVGGTHSGMFIDVAALIRAELAAMGMTADASVLVGLGMLPGAFRGVDAPNLASNTIYALTELDRVVSQGNYTADYRNGTRIELGQAPFDLYLVVDGVDELGRTWGSREDLCRMVARSLWLLAASRLGEQNDSILDNLLAGLHGRTQDGHCKIFGSLGWSEIRFPAEAIIRWCGARLGRDVIALVMEPPDIERVAEEVNAWRQALGLTVEAIIEQVGQDDTGAPMAVDLTSPAYLATTPDEQVPAAALQYVADYRRLQVEGDYRVHSRRASQSLEARLIAAIQTRASAAVETPGMGIEWTRAILDGLAEAISQTVQAAQIQRETVARELERLEAEAEQRAEALRRAGEGGWLFRRSRVTSACQRFFESNQLLETVRLEGLLLDRALATLSAIHAAVLSQSRLYLTVAAQLQAVEARLTGLQATETQALQRRGGHPALSLGDAVLWEELFQGGQAEAGALAHTWLANGAAITWANGSVDTITTRLLDLAQRPYQPLQRLTVEDMIQRQTGYTPEARRTALLDDARPAWTFDATRLGHDDEPRRVVLLGVYDQATSLYHEHDVMGVSVVSTGDPHSLMALAVAAGLPMSALQGWPEWSRVTFDGRRDPALYATLPQADKVVDQG